MQRLHEPDFIALHRWLQSTLKRHKLATFTNSLMRDALTIALGVKPAALLDFQLPPPVLELILRRIHTTDTPLFAPLVLLTLLTPSDTATFLPHRPSFLPLSRLHTSSIPLIDLSPSLSSPQLLTHDSAELVIGQLHSFTQLLSTTLHSDPSVSQLTLHSPPAVCLPTLCGWLLSYPVLYTFLSSTVIPSTNCLSHQPLTLFTSSLHSTPLLAKLSPSFASESGCVTLQSFSVPTNLLSESGVVSAIQAWEKRIAEMCNNESVRQWVQQLSVSKTAVCLPHVSL